MTAAVLFVGTLLFGSIACTPDAPKVPDERAIVVAVIDGDTVALDFDGQEERARLIGIDTPESVSRSVPDQCYGAEASAATKGLLPVGTEVLVARDIEARDRYGRLLVYIYRADDNLFINRWLLENGFADALFFEPNPSLRDDFTAVASAAEAAGVGLWGSCEGPDQPLVSDG